MNNELEALWKEAVMACFKIPSLYLTPEGVRKPRTPPPLSSMMAVLPGRDVNSGPSEYEVRSKVGDHSIVTLD